VDSDPGTPVWDELISERGGRGPTEFDGHQSWDDSEEARAAYDRGVAEAAATAEEFWGHPPAQPEPPPARAAG
jgi:hypothetical protein